MRLTRLPSKPIGTEFLNSFLLRASDPPAHQEKSSDVEEPVGHRGSSDPKEKKRSRIEP